MVLISKQGFTDIPNNCWQREWFVNAVALSGHETNVFFVMTEYEQKLLIPDPMRREAFLRGDEEAFYA